MQTHFEILSVILKNLLIKQYEANTVQAEQVSQ